MVKHYINNYFLQLKFWKAEQNIQVDSQILFFIYVSLSFIKKEDTF